MISVADLISVTTKNILLISKNNEDEFHRIKSLILDFYYCSLGYISSHNTNIIKMLDDNNKTLVFDNYRDIKIDPRTLIQENFNKVDKIVLRIQSVLLSIASKDSNPLEDDCSLKYLCQFLTNLRNVKFNKISSTEVANALEKEELSLNLSSNLYMDTISAVYESGMDWHLSQSSCANVPSYKNCSYIVPLVIFFSYNEIKNLFLFTIISKFPFINAKSFVEQFLFEQTVLFKNDQRFANYNLNFKNKIRYFPVDHPAGPQQTMFAILFGLDSVNTKLRETLSLDLMRTFIERFQKFSTNKSFDKFFKTNERTVEIYNLLRFKSQYFRRIADNQVYEDSYQYSADQITKSHLTEANEKLISDNALITKIADADSKKAQNAIEAAKSAEEKALSSEIKSVEAENKLYALQQTLIKSTSQAQTTQLQGANFISVIKYIADGNRGDLDVLSVLKFIQSAASDRIVVTQKALDSAKEVNSVFKRTDKLLELICKLASSYYDTVVENNDADGRNIFGSGAFSSHESDAINNSTNPKFLVDRTLRIDGKSIRLEKHLKIGTDNNNAYTLRIYFYFNPDDKKIYIGYCGKHPKNTKS